MFSTANLEESTVRALDRPTPQRHCMDLFLPISMETGHMANWPSYVAMVERRDGPSWLRDDDDDEFKNSDFNHHRQRK